MDINGYKAHREELKRIARKYSDKSKYPKGINSSNADLNDKIDYWGSLHYIFLWRLYQIKDKTSEKADMLRKKARKSLKRLEKCEEQLGIKPKNHGLDKIIEDIGFEA